MDGMHIMDNVPIIAGIIPLTTFCTMPSYKELLKQRESLEQQINEARRQELAGAISQVRALVAEFGLTQQDVFPAARARSATSGTKVAPKYRDPVTGQTWTGRGKAPKWIQNQNREQFAI
jgi:DNA-binding protein H-NS